MAGMLNIRVFAVTALIMQTPARYQRSHPVTVKHRTSSIATSLSGNPIGLFTNSQKGNSLLRFLILILRRQG